MAVGLAFASMVLLAVDCEAQSSLRGDHKVAMNHADTGARNWGAATLPWMLLWPFLRIWPVPLIPWVPVIGKARACGGARPDSSCPLPNGALIHTSPHTPNPIKACFVDSQACDCGTPGWGVAHLKACPPPGNVHLWPQTNAWIHNARPYSSAPETQCGAKSADLRSRVETKGWPAADVTWRQIP